MNECKFYITSLLTEQRTKFVEDNLSRFPEIEIIDSINGYNKEETISEFKSLAVPYPRKRGKVNLGTLACWMSKFKMWKFQIENEIPYMCLLEDDLKLKDGFVDYINKKLDHLKNDKTILSAMHHGEGYVTSLGSAKNLVGHLSKGINGPIDTQTSLFHALCPENKMVILIESHDDWEGEYYHKYDPRYKGVPYELLVPMNSGDIPKTPTIFRRELD
jgi:hypothetical protein